MWEVERFFAGFFVERYQAAGVGHIDKEDLSGGTGDRAAACGGEVPEWFTRSGVHSEDIFLAAEIDFAGVDAEMRGPGDIFCPDNFAGLTPDAKESALACLESEPEADRIFVGGEQRLYPSGGLSVIFEDE